MAEGCAVASVLGMLEEREAAARVRVEGLREEVARLAEVLEAAEIELDRRVIARGELVQVLAASAAETTAVTRTAQETVPSPVPGSVVPRWRDGLPVTVLDHQRILDMLAERRSAGKGPVKAREIAGELGLGTTPAKVEGVRSKARRLALPGRVGDVQCRPAVRGRARRRFIRVTIDHRITASLLVGNVS
ncbi:hypothetical protein [Streptomyces sp. NBC_00271]|uniref:hypothetical protein n=1 Tax=Streptomyces TaxID=1883 RepID=UPI002E2C1ACC|nr:hypothetical protein [Streptomyces sp. NBC_00271]